MKKAAKKTKAVKPKAKAVKAGKTRKTPSQGNPLKGEKVKVRAKRSDAAARYSAEVRKISEKDLARVRAIEKRLGAQFDK
jgi:hypothetical protein